MIFGMINSLLTSRAQKKEAKKINPVREFYSVSPFAKSTLHDAVNAFNGRIGGAVALERNIAANQANTMNNVNRNATDSAQALALAGQAQGQSNQAYNQLGIQEAQNHNAMLHNLNLANAGMTAEGDKVYNDKLNYYNEQQAQKQALLNASQMNKANAFNSLDNMIQSAASMAVGMPGGLSGGGGLLSGLMPGGGPGASMPSMAATRTAPTASGIPMGGFGFPVASGGIPQVWPTWRTGG